MGTAQGTIELWSIPSPGKAPVATFTAANKSTEVVSVQFSGDSPMLAAGTIGGKVELWDVASPARPPRELLTIGEADNVLAVAFSSDGGLLAADTVTSIQVWNVSTRKLVTVIPRSAISMTLSGDGSTLAVGIGNQVQLWDVATSRQIGELPLSGPAGVGDGLMAFSPDGTKLAVGAGNATELWNVPYLKNPVSYLCTLAAQPFPKDLWPSDVPGITYQPTCPAPPAS